LFPARPASRPRRVAVQPDAGASCLLTVPALPRPGLAAPAARPRRARPHPGDEHRRRPPAPDLRQGRLGSGISWGPRYMTDLLPLLLWMLVPVVAALRGLGRVCFLLAAGVAVAIQAIGAFCYTGVTDSAIFAVASGPRKMRAAWGWRNAPFVASWQQGLAPAELMTEVRGNLDAIEAGGRATSAVTAGQEGVAAGWALAGHATPWQVAIAIDGRQPGASHTFSDRTDIRGTLHEASPAGWRIPFATAGLPPGEHKLAALAWASEKGDVYYLGERKLTVRRAPAAASDEDLDAAFRTA